MRRPAPGVSTRRWAGNTLMEVLVVGSIFLAVLSALWMIYDSTVRVERSVSLKVDVDREVFAAVRHLEAALKNARLVQPSDWLNPQPATALEILPLALASDGQPQVTAEGFPIWGTAFAIRFENHELVRVNGTETRRLARLGDNGAVSFRRASQGLLEMDIEVEKIGLRDQKSSRKMTFQFRLFNQ